MVDYLAVLAAITLIACVLLVVMRSVAGPARRGRGMVRVAVVILIAAVAGGYGAFRVSRARGMMVMGDIVPRVRTTDRVVALTFDDGPAPRYVDGLLALLASERVRATFFVVGENLRDRPDVARRIVDAGHVLGNHSWSHPRMVGLPLAEVRRQVDDTDRVIRATGQGGPIFFRAPYSHKLVALPWHLSRTGRTVISWDVEPETYETSADGILRYTVERVRPGSIILLHPWFRSGEPTRQALPAIIRALRADGYEFVTVPELLARRAAR